MENPFSMKRRMRFRAQSSSVTRIYHNTDSFDQGQGQLQGKAMFKANVQIL